MTDTRKDIRKRDPDGNFKRAFMTGWTKAINGNRHGTIDDRKTHANMGNLFGWIFGEKDNKFRDQIWKLYLENALDVEEE